MLAVIFIRARKCEHSMCVNPFSSHKNCYRYYYTDFTGEETVAPRLRNLHSQVAEMGGSTPSLCSLVQFHVTLPLSICISESSDSDSIEGPVHANFNSDEFPCSQSLELEEM